VQRHLSPERKHNCFRPPLHGFTLVELLVVITIIGILISLLLPAVQAAREAARRMQCCNNLKQISLAVLNYEAANGTFPISIAHFDEGTTAVGTGMSWMIGILPYLENQSLFDALDIRGACQEGKGIMNPVNWPYIKKTIPAYMCPSDSPQKLTKTNVWEAVPATLEFAVMNYAGVMGSNSWGEGTLFASASCSSSCHDYIYYHKTSCSGSFWRHSVLAPVTMASFKDGASNTTIIGEVLPDYDDFKYWALGNGTYAGTCPPLNYFPPTGYDPWGDWSSLNGFRSRHAGGGEFAWADGHVSFINETIDRDAYRYLSTRAGSESVTPPE